MESLRAIDDWNAGMAAAGVARADGIVATHGPRDAELPWASVTKLLTGLAMLVALEEGTVDLDEPAGPPGSTLRHLLSHASGLQTDGEKSIAEPGRRRIYSNTGIEVAARLLEERAELPFPDYFAEAVARPLGLAGRLAGSPAHAYRGPLNDLLAVGRELLRPSLVSAGLLAFISSFDELVVALFLAGPNMTLPKKMFDNIMMEIDPTIAAVSVMQILLVSIVLGLIGRFGRGLRDSAR